MQTLETIRGQLNRIDYLDRGFRVGEWNDGFFVQIQYDEPCVVTGDMEVQRGRKWYLSAHSTDSEVIQTALKAALASAEHVVREHFLVDGVLPYGPHMDVDELVALLKVRDATSSRARP